MRKSTETSKKFVHGTERCRAESSHSIPNCGDERFVGSGQAVQT